MFPYRVKYTESESDIKNSNFLYKNTKHVKILSILGGKTKILKNNNCNMYKLHNSYFVICVNFVIVVIVGFLAFYLYILHV